MSDRTLGDSPYDFDLADPEGHECVRCGGDGVVELHDAPDLWGEDALSEENELVPCPECTGRRGRR